MNASREDSVYTFTEAQVSEARIILDRATNDLGPLTLGQATDLLLDNLNWLQGVQEAKYLLVEVNDLR